MTANMKPSGIEWIGDIPDNWNSGRIKDYYKIVTGFTPDTTISEYYDDENGLNWVSIADIHEKSRTVLETKSKISVRYIKEKYPQIVAKGSMLYSFKLSVGKVAFCDEDLYTNEAIASFIKSKDVCLDFLYYSSMFIIENANINIYGAPIMNQELIGTAPIIFPPLSEQTLIANFLDNQCEKIDSIVIDLENQIELLQKYKKSLITEAVTKGLDKTVSMKDSGIDSISSIPTNWTTSRIKDKINILTDYTANGSFASLAENVEYLDYEDYARVVRLTDLRVNFENVGIYVTEQAYNYLSKSSLFGGEILLANVGAYAGLMCEMPKVKFNATLGPNMFLIKTKSDELLPHYLYYLSKSKFLEEELIMRATSSAQPKLNKLDVKTIHIVTPPISEQIQIANYLDNQCSKIDSIIESKKEQLEKITQHKKSLIYEYVTGKKRVKGAINNGN